MRVLSLDIGRNKTGVAISEETLGLVTPLKPLLFPINASSEQWFDNLISLLMKQFYDPKEIDTLVLGSWKDSEYKNQEMRRLVKKAMQIVKTKTSWKIFLVRETRTSIESREILRSMGFREKKICKSVDSYAASLLLIDYLELVKPLQVVSVV